MPRNSRQKRAIKAQKKTLVFESQKPIRIDMPISEGSQMTVNRCIGFSKGRTYIKSIHGPLPVNNQLV